MKNNIKTSQYYVNKLESERKRIDKFESALKNLESSNIDGMRMGKIHLANLYLNCIKLVFSKDKSFESIFPDYMKFLNYYKDVCSPTDSMYDIIDILSIGILLQDRKNQFMADLEQIILKYGSNDGMVVFFMDYLKDKTPQRTISVIDYFDKLLESDNKENILKDELELWYDKHSDAYWHNSHESKNNTFCGYWCFEIAALVKIFGIDDNLMRENQFYPYPEKS